MGVRVEVGAEKWESGLEGEGSDVGMRCINQKVSVDEMLPPEVTRYNNNTIGG